MIEFLQFLYEQNPSSGVVLERLVDAYALFYPALEKKIREKGRGFCNELIKRRVKINWACAARCSDIDEEMLELMKNCSFIVTDSGGIQEEATSPIIRKKVLVVRKTTDRPESVENQLAEIVGLNEKNITNSIKKTMKNPKLYSKKTPFGKGDASEKILNILKKSF